MAGRKPIEPTRGERHNMLTFVEPAGREPASKVGDRVIYAPLGRWRCDCGKEVVCRNRYVVKGTKKSCGCLLRATGEAWHKGKRVRDMSNETAEPIKALVTAIRELADKIERYALSEDQFSEIVKETNNG